MSALVALSYLIYGFFTAGAILVWFSRAFEKTELVGFSIFIAAIAAVIWPLLFAMYIYRAVEDALTS